MSEAHAALIIANFDYSDSFLRQLVAPAQDAEGLAQVLKDPSIGGFDVKTVVNRPSYEVSREIELFLSDRNRDDLLLLYFSGHGVKDEDGQLYLAMADTHHKLLRSTAVWANFVNDAMRRCRSRRQVLLLDCCYSGAFARGMLAKGDSEVGAKEHFEGRGRVVLAASDSMQYSFEGGEIEGKGVQSVFTSALIRGLQTGEADLDGDGEVNLDELYEYVRDRVTERTPNQSPVKWALDVQGEFIIARSPRLRAGTLPRDLQDAVESKFPSVREEAIRELSRLLSGRNLGLARAARDALMQLTDDDSRRVSAAARKCLAESEPVEMGKAMAAAAGPVELIVPASMLAEQAAEIVPVEKHPAGEEKRSEQPAVEEAPPSSLPLHEISDSATNSAILEPQHPIEIRSQPKWKRMSDSLLGVRVTAVLLVAVLLVAVVIGGLFWSRYEKKQATQATIAQEQKAIDAEEETKILQDERARAAVDSQAPGSGVPVRETPTKVDLPSPAAATTSKPSEVRSSEIKPSEAKPAAPKRIRVGGNIQGANLIFKVTPSYPSVARTARVQGNVIFDAVIGKDGSIRTLHLISGNPLLVPAAEDAVKQWRYKPTLLNDKPVEVETTIDVDFTLRPAQ